MGEGLAVIPSPVGWVAAGGVLNLGLESLRITLVASPIHHARTRGMYGPTGPMQHARCHNVLKLRVGGFVWKLGTHDPVIIAAVTRLVLAA